MKDLPMETDRFFWADQMQRSARLSFYALIYLLLLSLLAYNSAIIFCIHVPSSLIVRHQVEEERLLPPPVNVAVHESTKFVPVTSSSTKLQSSHEMDSENLNGYLMAHSPLLHTDRNFAVLRNKNHDLYRRRKRKIRYRRRSIKIFGFEEDHRGVKFEERVTDFFNSACELQFFMTWISPIEAFGDRELFSVESLFKAHPNGCLIITSDSMDSRNGTLILKPFTEKGFKVTAISPDFDFLFKNTAAGAWFDQLRRGTVKPGEVSLGQNLSNLLRLGLLYRFGGIYLDTDVIVLKSFSQLKNSIGAQTVDLSTGNWSRLNNAVMIFDKGHPLVHKFIQEFALTFNGNKWGHNGPYLVSRVVSRLSGRLRYDVTVLPPVTFYPVGWGKVSSLFRGPGNENNHRKWLLAKLRQIYSESFAVHLWNKQSKALEIEEGSILQHIMLSRCVFCNSSSPLFHTVK